MAHRLALELSGRVAAMASVAGLMASDLAGVMPTHAVSTLLIHGTQGPYVPMSGARSARGRLISLLRGSRGWGLVQRSLKRDRQSRTVGCVHPRASSDLM